MLPKVSILIPCYNAEKWIAQAINSALEQTYTNKEVIVVDDGSTDNSLEIIKSFGDSIYWESQANQGGNATRNRLLELSQGEWLQYLDSDDYLVSDKVEKQIEFCDQNPQPDIIYSPSIFEYWSEDSLKREVLPIPEPHDPWILLARWYLPQTGSPLWRKKALVDVGKWKPDQLCCQEHELYFRLLISGKKFIYCNYPGSIYRQWSEETVCRKDMNETYTQRLLIEKRIEEYLSITDQLTQERQKAINQARFECARKIWLFNKEWANSLIRLIRNRDSRFYPSGNSAPKLYQITYKMLGFSVAEYIAHFKRQIKQIVALNLFINYILS